MSIIGSVKTGFSSKVNYIEKTLEKTEHQVEMSAMRKFSSVPLNSDTIELLGNLTAKNGKSDIKLSEELALLLVSDVKGFMSSVKTNYPKTSKQFFEKVIQTVDDKEVLKELSKDVKLCENIVSNMGWSEDGTKVVLKKINSLKPEIQPTYIYNYILKQNKEKIFSNKNNNEILAEKALNKIAMPLTDKVVPFVTKAKRIMQLGGMLMFPGVELTRSFAHLLDGNFAEATTGFVNSFNALCTPEAIAVLKAFPDSMLHAVMTRANKTAPDIMEREVSCTSNAVSKGDSLNIIAGAKIIIVDMFLGKILGKNSQAYKSVEQTFKKIMG